MPYPLYPVTEMCMNLIFFQSTGFAYLLQMYKAPTLASAFLFLFLLLSSCLLFASFFKFCCQGFSVCSLVHCSVLVINLIWCCPLAQFSCFHAMFNHVVFQGLIFHFRSRVLLKWNFNTLIVHLLVLPFLVYFFHFIPNTCFFPNVSLPITWGYSLVSHFRGLVHHSTSAFSSHFVAIFI